MSINLLCFIFFSCVYGYENTAIYTFSQIYVIYTITLYITYQYCILYININQYHITYQIYIKYNIQYTH